jgi:hypothetical protein
MSLLITTLADYTHMPEELYDGLKKSAFVSFKLYSQNSRLSVLLVIPMSIILNYHSDALRRKSKERFS